MAEKSKVAEWFNGKSIFVTGGSGFMGKVLVEKLLYACPGVQKIYILLRFKRGKNPEERLKDMWQLPVFSRLREKDPNAIKKIKIVTGDLNSDGLGIKDIDLDIVLNSVNVIYHIGATLKLEAKLKDAIEQNTAGTVRILDFAKKVKNLEVFIYYSTAFCSADLDVFEEKVYPSPDDPEKVIEACKWLKDDALDVVTKALIKPHANTYTYSKRLAETLVANEKDNLPVCIIRPSIVCPSVAEPVPGWVDTLNGPMGLLVGAGKGVIRSMHCMAENRANIIPVDFAISATILITEKIATAKEKPNEVPVYNLTQDALMPVTFKEVLDRGRKVFYEYPFEMQIWYPDGDFRSSKLWHQFLCIFLHWLPAYFIDLLMLIFGQKRFMVRIAQKVSDGLELLEFFATRPWTFGSENFLGLIKNMSDADRKLFPIDFEMMPKDEYLKVSLLGTRQYCMKEPLSSLPRCRIQQKVLYVVHKLFVFSMYYFLFSTLITYSTTARGIYDFILEILRQLPIIGDFIPVKV